MWLLPLLHRVSAAATRVYYRLEIAGERVPARGPVLLVANHPNSLLDPALVSAAARRPVRFLAKSGLFSHPTVGWLVRGAGSIPVYRRIDDPAQVARNEEMFGAVHGALAAGSAVGIFPEGISHNEPSLAPLKTGAARIALGAADAVGGAFPIVPVGLVFREKDVFRSEALLVVGRPIAWDDLAGRGAADADAVRELTGRIARAMRAVSLNLERWEDAPVVEWAESIYAAEFGAEAEPLARLGRVNEVTRVLARLRESGDPAWAPLAAEVGRHGRALRRLGLRPADLHVSTETRAAVAWTLRRLPLASVSAFACATIGSVVYWLPYRATGAIAARTAPQPDTRSTHKLLVGIVAFAAWTVLLAGLAGRLVAPVAGLLALLALPTLGLVALHFFERLGEARRQAGRFVLLRRHRDRLAELRGRQRAIAERLRALREAVVVQPG